MLRRRFIEVTPFVEGFLARLSPDLGGTAAAWFKPFLGGTSREMVG
jgi:hypothetical protein